MANTLQKKVKFSKGQITPELIERTDLELFYSSASYLKNVVASIYGGIKTRRGTRLIDRIQIGYTSTKGIATLGMGGDVEKLQDPTNGYYETDLVGTNRTLYVIDYETERTDAIIKIKGISFKYRVPKVSCDLVRHGDRIVRGFFYIYNGKILDKGFGLSNSGYFTNDGVWGNSLPQWTSTVVDGKLTNFVITFSGQDDVKNGNGKAGKTDFTWHRNAPEKVYQFGVYVSLDKEEWTLLQTIPVDETPRDFQVLANQSFRYVKVEMLPTEDNIITSLTLQYADLLVRNESEISKDVKVLLIDYIFNNEQKYVIILNNENIYIYRNDELVSIVQSEGLKENYYDNLKYSYIDDTIIFTHEDMPPKRLIRKADNLWEFGDFPLKNIPYRLFGNEITEPKTIGITPSGLEGAIKITADSGVFTADYVGQYIDGNGGRVKITEFTSNTILKGYTVIPFYTTDKIASWDYIHGYEPVWSSTRGYPRTCCFANQRLFFGGSKEKPSTIWASRVGDYTNFKNSSNSSNDAIDFDMASNSVILNIIFNRGLHIFTSDFEASSPEGSFTPNEFKVTPLTQNGSIGSVNPQILNGVICYIEKTGKSLLNYVYDYQQSNYTSNNISKFTNLIKDPKKIATEINSAENIGDRLFIVLGDGTLLVDCLSFSEDVQAMTQFKTDGFIKDICSLRGDTYLLVYRNGYIYLEKLEDLKSDNTQYLKIEGNQLKYLEYYNGMELCIYDDNNKYYGKYFVNDGVLTFPMTLNGFYYVGIPFDFEIIGNPIVINNKSFNIKKRIAQAQVVCRNTKQIEFCNQLKRNCDVYDFKACTIYGSNITYKIKGEFYPIDILSISLTINYEG